MLKNFMFAGLVSVVAMTAHAQSVTDEEARVNDMAEQLQVVMLGLEERAEGYPAFIVDLQNGLATIEQADEQVGALIAQLIEATDQMDDESEFDTAIDEYKTATVKLIAEADASGIDVIKSSIPDLEASLARLEAADQNRTETVIEARNVIRSLEQNREAIAFFIRAGQIQRATELIEQNVVEFAAIVENGKELASGLVSAANP